MSFDRHGVLFPNERILWEGVPYQGLMFRALDLALVPFSLLFGGFAIFWNAGVWDDGAPLDFKLFGLPFLAIGVYLIVGRFLVDAWIRRHQHYLVTDRRVLIVTGVPWRRTKSLDVQRQPCLELSERGDGSGTTRFDSEVWLGRDLGIWSPALSRYPQFIRIENVRTVYDLIDRQG